jgi:hypothetical protein
MYNCDECPVADMLAELEDDAQNFEAWTLFHRCVTRFTVDTHIAHVMLEREVAEREKDDAFELMDRLTVLYDSLHPPPEKK